MRDSLDRATAQGAFGVPSAIARAICNRHLAGMVGVALISMGSLGYAEVPRDPHEECDPRALMEAVAARVWLPPVKLAAIVDEFVELPPNAIRLAQMALNDFAGRRSRNAMGNC